MNNTDFFKYARNNADINLQLIETILLMDDKTNFKLSEELTEMLECVLEKNWQMYKLTNEKLIENGILL